MFDPSPLPDLAGRTILQVLPALVGGGVERGTIDMAGAIEAAGGRALVASAGGPMVRELDRRGIRHLTLPLATKNPLRLARNARRLAALVRQEGIDLIHARSRAPAWSALLAARRTGTPFVTTVHAPYPTQNALKRRYNAVMMRGDRVIAISGFVARYAEGYGVGPDRLRTIPRGIDLARFTPSQVAPARMVALARHWRLPEDRPLILMPGRLARWKGQAVLIEALSRLGRPDLRCIILGAEPGTARERAQLEALVDARGLSPVVQIAEACEDMPAAYMLADLVIHASIEPEGFGRVVTEAMAMGRPVVAADGGAPAEIVEPGRTGWLVPPGDADALAAAIGHALDLGAEPRAAMAQAARAAVVERYSLERMAASTIAVYRELLTAG